MYWIVIIILIIAILIHKISYLQNNYLDIPNATPISCPEFDTKKKSIKDYISYNGVKMNF